MDRPSISTTPRIALSTVTDGSLRGPVEPLDAGFAERRRAFLDRHNLQAEHVSLVYVDYETDDFCRYRELDATDDGTALSGRPVQPADTLITRATDQALFLPLGDCIGAVISDPTQPLLALAHLGRHSLEQHGAAKTITHLATVYGADPAALQVWLSPTVSGERYPLHAFHGASMLQVAREQLQSAGILAEHITAHPSTTDQDPDFFSHSEYLAGRRTENGRHAVVAWLPSA